VITQPGEDRVEIRRGARVIGQHPRAAHGQMSFDPPTAPRSRRSPWRRWAAPTGRHRRKRNDARLGPKAAEEPATLRACAALSDDGTVQPVDLARYDQLWQQP
jgi:hypothetical protein